MREVRIEAEQLRAKFLRERLDAKGDEPKFESCAVFGQAWLQPRGPTPGLGP